MEQLPRDEESIFDADFFVQFPIQFVLVVHLIHKKQDTHSKRNTHTINGTTLLNRAKRDKTLKTPTCHTAGF